MRIVVQSVNVPGMSTIGYGVGVNDQGDIVHFAGDHRPMRDLAEFLNSEVEGLTVEGITVDLEPWQILSVIPKGGSDVNDDHQAKD